MQSDKTRPSAPLKKGEKDVVRAAMRYYRWLGKPPSRPERYYRGQPNHQLIATCHSLAQRKPSGK